MASNISIGHGGEVGLRLDGMFRQPVAGKDRLAGLD